MRFEVQKASSSSYRDIVELNRLDDLRLFVAHLGKEQRTGRYLPLVIDFNVGNDAWGHTFQFEAPLEEELSGVILIYDDYI